jgi:hypothetical protein
VSGSEAAGAASMNYKKELEKVTITDDDRKNLSPESLKALEDALKDLKEREFEDVVFTNPEKFEMTGMQPVGGKPVDWNPKKPPQK